VHHVRQRRSIVGIKGLRVVREADARHGGNPSTGCRAVREDGPRVRACDGEAVVKPLVTCGNQFPRGRACMM